MIQKKPDGCGCFGPRLEPKATWLAVTIRNFFLLAASIGLLLLHNISGVEAAPVHAVVSIFIFTVAVLLGLPIQNIGALLQQSKPNVDRRQFLRQAGAVTAGSVGLAVSTSVDRVQAQTRSPGLVVEHETELSSLAEALQQCPREVPIPSSLPNGYELRRVGAFFEKNTQEKVVRDLVLHYQQDADHQLVVMLSKREVSAPPFEQTVLEHYTVGPYTAKIVLASSDAHVLIWKDEAWDISIQGLNVNDDELVGVARSMYAKA